MKKIKHWWRKQEPIFKKDFKFQIIIGIISLIFGSPALICVIIPVITYTLFHSYVFRIEKYVYIKIIKHHKDYIYLSKQLNKNNNELIHNLEGSIKTYEGLLNSTYVFVPWPESQKFTIHKKFNECYEVENGCMVPYNIYRNAHKIIV